LKPDQQTIDCRGLPCPQPVLRCKERIEKESPDSFRILVDNEAARENVKRFAAGKGYSVDARTSGRDIELTLSRKAGDEGKSADAGMTCEIMSPEELARIEQKICVLLTSDRIGLGDDVLGAKLMFNFINTLPELGRELWRVVLLNSGVRLATEGSPVAPKLLELEKSGISILVCGTCLDHFSLLDKKVVGETTNMLDVVTSLQLASKIITP